MLLPLLFGPLIGHYRVAILHSNGREIPAQTCEEALEFGLDYSTTRPSPPPPPRVLPPLRIPEIGLPEKLPFIYGAGDRRIRPKDYMPEELPLQPLEGATEDIARIGKILREAANGNRTRISVFGASHTGGDYFTGHLRRVMQYRYGDIGHGFIMPVSMFRHSRATDINRCSTMTWLTDFVGKSEGHNDRYFGLGMTASSGDPLDFAWIENTHENPLGRNSSIYDIFTLQQPDGGTLLVKLDAQKPVLIPTFNHSIKFQHTRLETLEAPHRLTFSPLGDAPVRLFGVSVENPGPGILVDAIGIRGREAKTWLKWDYDIFEQTFHALSPDIAVLAYGTNEANATEYSMNSYEKDLRKVLSKLRKAAPSIGCILVGPSDRGKKFKRSKNKYRVWQRTMMVADVQRSVAPEFGCVFWDWQQATGGEGSMISWRFTEPPLAARDLIHFSAAGYVHSAERFIAALDNAMENY